jgi:hypothetical protein
MPYGLIKVDNITFTNAGSDQTISVSGLLASTSGNLTVTGTVSGNTIKGQTISGVTVTGTTANFTSGNFTSISGGTYTITSGVFAPGSAANPSISFTSYPNTGFYRPGANEIAISTNGTGRLFVDASGQVGVGVAAPSSVLEVSQSVNGNAFAIVANSNPGTGAIAALSASNGTSNAVFGIGGTGYAQYGQIRPGGAAIYTSSAAGIGLSADNASGYISFGTGSGASERMRLDSSGRLGLGTSAPPALFSAHSTDTSADFFIGEFQSTANPTGLSNTYVKFEKGDGYGGAVGGFVEQGVGSGLKLAALNTGTLTDVVTIRHTGLVGIGTTSPGTALDVVGVIRSKAAGGEGGQITLTDVSNTEVFNVDVDNAGIIRLFSTVSNKDIQFGQLVGTGCNINFYTGQLERARIDSSGRLLVGTSSNRTGAALQIEGTTFGTSLGTITNNSANSAPAYFQLIKSRGTSVGSQALVSNGDGLGNVQFVGTDGTQQLVAAAIEGIVDGTPGTNDMPGRLMFSTTADGASSPTERARITSDGFLRVGKSSADINVQGISLAPFGTAAFSRDAEIPLFVNRNTDDGALVVFRQEGTDEGSISVSGTTVSYNGAHLSRWSQLPGGAERTEILRGTVLSNIDEMCGWGEEANEQLNRMKVSDVEGDPNVAGVFQAWDDDDDTYTDDFYCAMTGDFIIRVAEGVTVQRGDLLMSAGDGTAKPQDDDIVRSKTIAKVTSSHVTCTYDDGSYCVPCVLMAC